MWRGGGGGGGGSERRLGLTWGKEVGRRPKEGRCGEGVGGVVAVFGQVFFLSPWSPTATSASSTALPTAAAQRATLAAHCRHGTSGELITAQIGWKHTHTYTFVYYT